MCGGMIVSRQDTSLFSLVYRSVGKRVGDAMQTPPFSESGDKGLFLRFRDIVAPLSPFSTAANVAPGLKCPHCPPPPLLPTWCSFPCNAGPERPGLSLFKRRRARETGSVPGIWKAPPRPTSQEYGWESSSLFPPGINCWLREVWFSFRALPFSLRPCLSETCGTPYVLLRLLHWRRCFARRRGCWSGKWWRRGRGGKGGIPRGKWKISPASLSSSSLLHPLRRLRAKSQFHPARELV